MAKVASDKLPVIVLYSKSGSARVFLKKLFQENYFLIEVSSTKEALEKIATTKTFAVIFDEKTKIDLHQICKEIRKLPESEEITILIISNNLKKSFMKDLIKSGASDFIREPLEETQVLETLERAKKTKSLEKKITPIASSLSQSILAGAQTSLCKTRISIHDSVIKQIIKTLEAKKHLCLILISLSHIDKVQERWGSEALNDLNIKVKERLIGFLRAQDLLFSISSSIYLILLPSTSKLAAEITAEEVEKDFQSNKFTTAKGSVRLPVSLSTFSLTDDELKTNKAYENLEKMLTKGEDYLEQTKKISSKIVFGE
jgi:PleD family two-component response regulator